jgi:hypothetical protein
METILKVSNLVTKNKSCVEINIDIFLYNFRTELVYFITFIDDIILIIVNNLLSMIYLHYKTHFKKTKNLSTSIL